MSCQDEVLRISKKLDKIISSKNVVSCRSVLLKAAPAAPAPTNDVGAWAGDEASGAAGNYWPPTASAGHRRH